jgi:glyoxylase-like metal-dependent hydrolase (beta-lactamase superfamily II)
MKRGNKMLVQITDAVYKLTVVFPHGGNVNCYFLKGDKGYTVIDTGINSEQVIHLWERILASGIAIEKIVITHTHPDHIGMAGWLQKRLHVPVSLSKKGYEGMLNTNQKLLEYENGRDENHPYAFFLKHGGPIVPYKRMLERMSTMLFEPDDLFEDGEEICLGNGIYKAIWTPGHAPDHFCFYNRENQCLIVGDHVLGDISPVVILWSDDDGNPLEDYFQSLDKILNYQVELALPGHGEVISNLKLRVSEIRNGHLFRMRQIIGIVKGNGISAGDVTRVLYNNESSEGRFMSEFQMTLARLNYLESQGQVSSQDHNGIMLFFRN